MPSSAAEVLCSQCDQRATCRVERFAGARLQWTAIACWRHGPTLVRLASSAAGGVVVLRQEPSQGEGPPPARSSRSLDREGNVVWGVGVEGQGRST